MRAHNTSSLAHIFIKRTRDFLSHIHTYTMCLYVYTYISPVGFRSEIVSHLSLSTPYLFLILSPSPGSLVFVLSHAFRTAPLPLFYIHSPSRLVHLPLHFALLSLSLEYIHSCARRGEREKSRVMCFTLDRSYIYFLSRLVSTHILGSCQNRSLLPCTHSSVSAFFACPSLLFFLSNLLARVASRQAVRRQCT